MDKDPFEDFFRSTEDFLSDRKIHEQYRQCIAYSPIENSDEPLVRRGKNRFINFCSNNYLGLAQSLEVKRAATEAMEKYGIGTGGSRLISGTTALHEDLEHELAKIKSTESALLFSSGYLANGGIIEVLTETSLFGKIPFLFDKLSHASIIDAVTSNSAAPWKTFRHNDYNHLESLLQKMAVTNGRPSSVVITEGVFSMDGDMAPLSEIYEVCKRYNSLLVVDDAHGTGTVGNGLGSVHAAGLNGAPGIIITGTLSKALGSQGGFIAGPKVLRELLINKSKKFIYDTSPAIPTIAGALAAANIIRRSDELNKRLQENIDYLESRLGLAKQGTPIIPYHIGSNKDAADKSAELLEKNILTVAIKPPTVPVGTSRLRITVTSRHTRAHLDALAEALNPQIN